MNLLKVFLATVLILDAALVLATTANIASNPAQVFSAATSNTGSGLQAQ
jgi:hypothetical protein